MTSINSRHLVDAELSPLLELFPMTVLSHEVLAEARARELPLPIDPEVEAAVAVEERRIPGPAGAPEVEIFIHRPRGTSDVLPCILHIHGGGYVMGSVPVPWPCCTSPWSWSSAAYWCRSNTAW